MDAILKLYKAFSPIATLLDPELFAKACNPNAMLCCPPLFSLSAPNPTAVLFRVRPFRFCELSVPRVVFPLSLTFNPFNWLKLIDISRFVNWNEIIKLLDIILLSDLRMHRIKFVPLPFISLALETGAVISQPPAGLA